jgi:tetratricopeptide (TPR) repeat protein
MIIKRHSNPPVFSLLLFVLLFSGCSLFGVVGDWFSQGYENTVSYFNAYYNAKRLFNEAEEEIEGSRLSARGRSTVTPAPSGIPNTARQKLTQVIDKCSNILSFYPRSALVDDALLLIGKSYFYQSEFVKAERKFSELLAQYPNGEHSLEAQLWFLKTLHRLNRFDDALKAGALLTEAAAQVGEEEIVAEAYQTLGEMAVERNELRPAIELYAKAINASSDDLLRGTLQAKIGDLLVQLGDHGEAARAYRKIWEYTDDAYLQYYGGLQAARSLREVEQNDAALTLLEDLLSDFRFAQYENVIRFELGNTYAKEGNVARAIDEFRYLDTTYAKTEIGTKAAFELGKLLQYEVGDFAQAKVAYEHASFLPTLPESKEAQRRSAALTRYFELQKKYFLHDSLLFAQQNDSLWRAVDSILHAPARVAVVNSRDSSQVEDSTSVSQLKDAVNQSSLGPELPVRLNQDSLRAILSGVSYELGELFYSELEVPDSAFFWYRHSLRLHRDSTRVGRTLFILSEIVRSNPERGFGDADDLYRQIVRECPDTPYAEEAARRLGIKVAPKQRDEAEPLYERAESLSVRGDVNDAVELWKSILRRFPQSPTAPRAKLALAWTYEHQLRQPDSAAAYYRMVAEQHATSEFGKVALRRVPSVETPAQQLVSPPDTTSQVQPLQPKQEDRQPRIDIDPEEERVLRARSDTTRTRRGVIKE